MMVVAPEILCTLSCSRIWALTDEDYGRLKALTSKHSMEQPFILGTMGS